MVKLTDFGLAKTLEDTTAFTNTYVGTKVYMSPERITKNTHSFASDIWSLGLIIYELACGEFPYKDSENIILYTEPLLNGPEPTLPDDKTFSQDLQNFITRCLKKDPRERDTITELCVNFKINFYRHILGY